MSPGHPTRLPPSERQRVAVVGGGWAGMAAAVRAATDGHHVTVYEASRRWGGRARALPLTLPDGSPFLADNGQHILIGAYTDTLRLMQQVGVDTQAALLRTPLALVDPHGHGLRLPAHAPGPRWLSNRLPLAVLSGVLRARGWSWVDKLALLRTAARWQAAGFECPPDTSVSQLCAGLPAGLRQRFIEPLCISALNTPAERASGRIFLRVLRDALFSAPGASDLLLPLTDLGTLFPEAAARWLAAPPRAADLRLGERVHTLLPLPGGGWQVNGHAHHRVVWANFDQKQGLALIDKALTAAFLDKEWPPSARQWRQRAEALRFESIATVYAWAPPPAGAQRTLLPQPMTALWPSAHQPGQFVFDKSWLGGPRGLLAFVVSASTGDAQTLQHQTVAQAQAQLGLVVTPLKTVVEKRATFACTPGLLRPPAQLAPGLTAAGDHIEGPYPATLEGAVRSGWHAGGAPGEALP